MQYYYTNIVKKLGKKSAKENIGLIDLYCLKKT